MYVKYPLLLIKTKFTCKITIFGCMKSYKKSGEKKNWWEKSVLLLRNLSTKFFINILIMKKQCMLVYILRIQNYLPSFVFTGELIFFFSFCLYINLTFGIIIQTLNFKKYLLPIVYVI